MNRRYRLKMTKPIESRDETRFFEHGQVTFCTRDFPSGTAALDVTMPCCLFQAVVPQLLAAGYIDHPRIHQPLSVWLPQITQERMNLFGGTQSAADQVNIAVRAWVQQLLSIFEKLSVFTKDPSDIIPMLPLGIYVDFRWRCRIDGILKVMEGVQAQSHVAGVPEFQWALASVLQCVLEDYAAWEARKPSALSR
jgi:hypothetical protein